MPNILLVDDDPSAIQLMSRVLAGVARVRFATSGIEALRLAHEQRPDLVLMDAEMPGMTGFEVCEAMKADHGLDEVPVIFVTSHRESDFEESCFAVGAADYISKPVRPTVVIARVQTQLRLKLAADQLRREAHTDRLTGLANRRALDEALAREWARARRTRQPLSVLLIDIDHFKRYNDHFGHLGGDDCLTAVARTLQACTSRPADLVARFGGEEFALLLPETDRAGAQRVAARVLERIEALALPHPLSGVGPHLSVSVGGASYDEDTPGWLPDSRPSRFGDDDAGTPPAAVLDLVGAADRALYAAKDAGRAQAAHHDIDAPTATQPHAAGVT